MSETPHVVYDCNTLLQALGSPRGPAGTCVQFVFDSRVKLFLSSTVLRELYEAVSRPKVVRKLKLRSDRVDRFVSALQLKGTILTGFAEPFSYPRDPDDSHYVNLALAADAKLIVSRDRDLLDLMDNSIPESLDFQHRFPSLRILDPVAFLRELAEQDQL